jgi:hypothetical protein
MNPVPLSLCGAGLRVELADECGKALQLEEEMEKARTIRDRLWKEL